MNRLSLFPSANWNASHMLALNEAGTMLAYGSRCDIIILENVHQDSFNEIDGNFISRAHRNSRVSALIFIKHELDGQVVESLASCGEDAYIKLWNPQTRALTHKFLMKKTNPAVKFVDMDIFKSNSTIVCVAEEKSVVKWDLQKNKVAIFSVEGKEYFNCIAACPHEPDLVAIGTRLGLVLIYSLKGDGKLKHKIPCHSRDVVSVSWCPVPYNIFALDRLREDPSFNESEWREKDRSLLLASSSKERSIYVCRAGTTGYCEALLKIPLKMNANNNNSRLPSSRNLNIDRGRFVQWIYPSVFLTHTDFNEVICMKFSSKVESKAQVVSDVKLDVRLLHNSHHGAINNFAVQVLDGADLNFRVWSSSTDRLLIRSGYNVNHKEKSLTLPLLSGFVFALDIAPTTFDSLAIGTGDGKVTLWNTSTEHFIDTTTLSNKIVKCKIMSLKWHPHEEGILAFGTSEGRVGIFDISMGSKSSWLFKAYHHKPIYKLCWGPAIVIDSGTCSPKGKFRGDLFLFAVGNGDILQFNPNDVKGTPMSLSVDVLSSIEEKCGCKYKSDMCYESDHDVLVVGLSNGDVCLFSSKTFEFQHVIKEQPKSIMALTWHPKYILDSPDQTSPFSNWLATAGEHVFVYDVDNDGKNAPKKVASLELHTSRILDIAWSPHINGRLLSCSADSTVIVWDVISQTVVGRYVKHGAQVLCGVWSLTNKDVIITGSSDFTCRMWSVSMEADTNNSKEIKKIVEKPIEPNVINSQGRTNEMSEPSVNTSTTKNCKMETFLPSISHDIHSCHLLDVVVKKTISVRQDDDENIPVCRTNGHDSSLSPSKLFTRSEESFINTDLSTSEIDDSFSAVQQPVKMNGHHSPPSIGDSQIKLTKNKKYASIDSEYNYSQLFSSKEELLRLVQYEESVLESTGSKNLFVLVQARHDLKAKITEAIEKNQVTEHMLALAASVSPKLWKDACNVYVEQLIQSEQLMQAVNFLLALNKDEEAVDLLCDKNRFKEAFTIARLRFDDETICRNVLEKWISFCYASGLYRLAAHCYLFQKEEEKAGTILNKSKNFQDLILAAKLLKPYQPKRAIELAADCFKRHLLQISVEDLHDLLTTFPEIKFTKIWYMSLKYLTKEPANTASITKWLIGLAQEKDDQVLKSVEDVDFEKLQKIIVDNTFNMNFEELTKYVSAQIALYMSGISDPALRKTALRHYIRGLYYCDNYRRANSNQPMSDSAYPMMKLLHLIFPKGIMSAMDATDESYSDLKVPMKSVHAYFCIFAVTWLMNCNELPKSLRAVESTISPDTNECHAEWVRATSVVKDPRRKLEKIHQILSLFSEDTFGADVAQYLQHKIKVNQFDRGSPKDQIDVQTMKNPMMIADTIENGVNESSTDVKMCREKMAEFEKERVVVPNPCQFLCSVRDYVEKHRDVDPPMVSNLQTVLNKAAETFGFPKD